MNQHIFQIDSYNTNFLGAAILLVSLLLLGLGALIVKKEKFSLPSVIMATLIILICIWLISLSLMYWSIQYPLAFFWIKTIYLAILTLIFIITLIWVIATRDIRKRRQMESELTYLATHDYLTGLFNRRRFEEKLAHYIASGKRFKKNNALLIIDIDRFREINDSFGHQTGDELLSRIAQILKKHLRKIDVVSRIDGDTFAIILPDMNCERAKRVVEKLLRVINHTTFTIGEQTLSVTICIGTALFPKTDDTVGDLLGNAYLAMYKAKKEGRNTYSVYECSDTWFPPFAKKDAAWAECVRNAFKEDKFILYAQPIYSLRKNIPVYYELLIRIQEDKDNIILPAAFLSIADRYGLTREINAWVIKKVFSFLKVHQDIRLSCNLASNALTDVNLYNLLKSNVEKNPIKSGQIVLEITENAIIKNINSAIEFIKYCKALGFSFALDDFGVGLSSLTYLKHLPVDFLKLDGSFIQKIPANPMDKELVRSMVNIAKILGIKTIAEFVENEATVQILKDLNVDYAQGYYYSKPQPLNQIFLSHPLK